MLISRFESNNDKKIGHKLVIAAVTRSCFSVENIGKSESPSIFRVSFVA